VIEIAAVRVAAGRIVGEYSTLVNPRRAIPRMITSLTGIANEAVGNAPYFEQVVPAVTASLGGRVFVGHNAMFDWRFVCAEMERCTGRTLTGRQFCTLRVARRLLPNLPSRSLCALADYFGVEMTTHHRALDDAVATARLLLRFLEILSEHGVHDWHALDAFYRKSRRKKRRKAWPVPMDMA
jgi:DNA polymerase III epsilon subunit family exonuclease